MRPRHPRVRAQRKTATKLLIFLQLYAININYFIIQSLSFCHKSV